MSFGVSFPAVAVRLRLALSIGIATMLAPVLSLLRPNATYVTFNILEGILYPVLTGGALIVGVLLVLLIAESPLRLSRFWLARVLAAAVLVNLGVDIFYGAIGMDLAQLLAKVGPGENPAKYRDQVRDISNVALLILLGIASHRAAFLGKLYKLFVIFVAVAAVLTAYRATPIVWVELAEASQRPARQEDKPARHVVWVVFDELDQRELERATAAGSLPNFQRLHASGLNAVQARSPAARTHVAIPELLAGTAFASVSSLAPDMLTVTPAGGGAPVDFDEVDTVVDAVQTKGGPVHIVGFFHPYCRLFPQVSDCRAYSIQNMRGLTFLLNALHTVSLSQSKRILPLFGVDWRRDELIWGDQMAYITRKQVEDLTEFRPGSAALHFFHLNVPHFPRNRYGEKLFGAQAKGSGKAGDEAYEFNLKVTDHVLGVILERIEQSPESRVLVVVSGDHGRRPLDWRMRGIDDRADALRRVPFLAWIKGERGAARIEERIETIGTRELVESYLAGEVNTQEDVRRFLLSRLTSGARPGTPPATAR
jgi:hypothetical protein